MENNQLHQLQILIRDAIADLGGYWNPEFSFLRIVEEHGELVDAFATIDSKNGIGIFAEELADLFIITSCLIDQMDGQLACNKAFKINSIQDSLNTLAIINGEIARVINATVGPKKPKKGEELDSIENLGNALIGTILSIANYCAIDLEDLVRQKVALFSVRDKGRFEPT